MQLFHSFFQLKSQPDVSNPQHFWRPNIKCRAVRKKVSVALGLPADATALSNLKRPAAVAPGLS